MELEIKNIIHFSTIGLEILGVGIIVGGILLASLIILLRLRKGISKQNIYEEYRRLLGRGILLGLEIFIAADIIRTTAIEPTFKSVGVLAAIVLIRTFLSFTLEVEMTGRWPWQNRPKE
jgi:uncharacterized membrane protein